MTGKRPYIGQPVEHAVAHLADANVRGLVVVDDGWPVGVFTHTEAIQVRAMPRELLSTPVEELMSYEVLCLDASTPLVHVAGQAMAMNVRRVFAVEGRRLCGIATGIPGRSSLRPSIHWAVPCPLASLRT